jgi:hypothetical protein
MCSGDGEALKKCADAEDPMEFVGVELPAADDRSQKEMAACFVEEFFRMGFDRGRLEAMFRDPFYGALHRIYRDFGEGYVGNLLDEYEEVFGRRAAVNHTGG